MEFKKYLFMMLVVVVGKWLSSVKMILSFELDSSIFFLPHSLDVLFYAPKLQKKLRT